MPMWFTKNQPNTTQLADGTTINCINAPEAQMLDRHVKGYFANGIAVKDGDTIFDVGANIGVFAVRMTQQYPQAQVYAFEPLPPIYNVLERNALRYAPRIVALPMGVSDVVEEVTFNYFPNSPALSTAHLEDWADDSNKLARAVEGNLHHAPAKFAWVRWLPKPVFRWIANYLQAGKKDYRCQLTTLSKVIAEHNINRIDLLKIDCEGAELAVLKGITAADWQKIQQIVAEVHDVQHRLAEVVDLCKRHGFVKITVEKDVVMGDTPMFNVFAIR